MFFNKLSITQPLFMLVLELSLFLMMATVTFGIRLPQNGPLLLNSNYRRYQFSNHLTNRMERDGNQINHQYPQQRTDKVAVDKQIGPLRKPTILNSFHLPRTSSYRIHPGNSIERMKDIDSTLTGATNADPDWRMALNLAINAIANSIDQLRDTKVKSKNEGMGILTLLSRSNQENGEARASVERQQQGIFARIVEFLIRLFTRIIRDCQSQLISLITGCQPTTLPTPLITTTPAPTTKNPTEKSQTKMNTPTTSTSLKTTETTATTSTSTTIATNSITYASTIQTETTTTTSTPSTDPTSTSNPTTTTIPTALTQSSSTNTPTSVTVTSQTPTTTQTTSLVTSTRETTLSSTTTRTTAETTSTSPSLTSTTTSTPTETPIWTMTPETPATTTTTNGSETTSRLTTNNIPATTTTSGVTTSATTTTSRVTTSATTTTNAIPTSSVNTTPMTSSTTISTATTSTTSGTSTATPNWTTTTRQTTITTPSSTAAVEPFVFNIVYGAFNLRRTSPTTLPNL